MPVDTRGFGQEQIGKRLRVRLWNGEVEEIRLLELTVCPEPEPCCGITYRLIASHGGDGTKENGEVYWTGFHEVEKFEVLGD